MPCDLRIDHVYVVSCSYRARADDLDRFQCCGGLLTSLSHPQARKLTTERVPAVDTMMSYSNRPAFLRRLTALDT